MNALLKLSSFLLDEHYRAGFRRPWTRGGCSAVHGQSELAGDALQLLLRADGPQHQSLRGRKEGNGEIEEASMYKEAGFIVA